MRFAGRTGLTGVHHKTLLLLMYIRDDDGRDDVHQVDVYGSGSVLGPETGLGCV